MLGAGGDVADAAARRLKSFAEGFAEDLPEGDGWRALGPLRIHRAAGVGEGHGAWMVEGWCARTTQEAVVQQHLLEVRAEDCVVELPVSD